MRYSAAVPHSQTHAGFRRRTPLAQNGVGLPPQQTTEERLHDAEERLGIRPIGVPRNLAAIALNLATGAFDRGMGGLASLGRGCRVMHFAAISPPGEAANVLNMWS